MKCIIIEDQPPAQRILKKFIEDTGSLQIAGVFSDAMQAMEFLRSEKVDLIFLDIHLPKISGIEFLKTLPEAPAVILTTAYPEYALEGYELNVIDYLLKPFSFERFLKAVAKVPSRSHDKVTTNLDLAKTNTRKEIFIKSGYEHHKIEIEDILYLHSDSDYTEIITADKKYLSSDSLRFWEENLDASKFARVHKSYLVHISKIKKLSGNQIHLSDKLRIPIGRAFKEAFMKRITK